MKLPSPLLLQLVQNELWLLKYLQNASFQAGRRAHILVFPCNRVIELRYLT